jgi:hypothetical protein
LNPLAERTCFFLVRRGGAGAAEAEAEADLAALCAALELADIGAWCAAEAEGRVLGAALGAAKARFRAV